MTPDVLRVHDLLVYYDTPAGAVTAGNHTMAACPISDIRI